MSTIPACTSSEIGELASAATTNTGLLSCEVGLPTTGGATARITLE